jgi:hypothetical protein
LQPNPISCITNARPSSPSRPGILDQRHRGEEHRHQRDEREHRADAVDEAFENEAAQQVGRLRQCGREDIALERVEQPLHRVLQRHAHAVDHLEQREHREQERGDAEPRMQQDPIEAGGEAGRQHGGQVCAVLAQARRFVLACLARRHPAEFGGLRRAARAEHGRERTFRGIDALAVLGGHRDDRHAHFPGEPLGVDDDAEPRRFVRHVEDDDERHAGCPERQDERQLQLEPRSVHHGHDGVERDRAEELLHQRFVFGVSVERIHAGQVRELHHLAADGHARGRDVDRHAGPVRDAGRGSREPVEQRRLAGVRGADHRDRADVPAGGVHALPGQRRWPSRPRWMWSSTTARASARRIISSVGPMARCSGPPNGARRSIATRLPGMRPRAAMRSPAIPEAWTDVMDAEWSGASWSRVRFMRARPFANDSHCPIVCPCPQRNAVDP